MKELDQIIVRQLPNASRDDCSTWLVDQLVQDIGIVCLRIYHHVFGTYPPSLELELCGRYRLGAGNYWERHGAPREINMLYVGPPNSPAYDPRVFARVLTPHKVVGTILVRPTWHELLADNGVVMLDVRGKVCVS